MIRALAILLAMAAVPALAQAPIASRVACEVLAGTDLSAKLGVPARVETAAVQAEGRLAPTGDVAAETFLGAERFGLHR